MIGAHCLRLGRLAIWLNLSVRVWGLVRNQNLPYLWLLYAGPVAVTWLRANWDSPIVLPRQARRALARGKTVDARGYAHRKLLTLALVVLTATVASAGEIVVRHKPGRTWNECRVEGTRTFTYFCDDAGVARPLSAAEASGAAWAAAWVAVEAGAPIVEAPERIRQRQHDELIREIQDLGEPYRVRGYWRRGTYVRPHWRHR